MKITIWKEDAETGIITQGDATLDGAIYGIYDSNYKLIEFELISKFNLIQIQY